VAVHVNNGHNIVFLKVTYDIDNAYWQHAGSMGRQ
jgi:hypothetical protein